LVVALSLPGAEQFVFGQHEASSFVRSFLFVRSFVRSFVSQLASQSAHNGSQLPVVADRENEEEDEKDGVQLSLAQEQGAASRWLAAGLSAAMVEGRATGPAKPTRGGEDS
jgi:hypothetical protein